MPAGPRVLIENAWYHLMVRGNQQQRVFFDEQDHRVCLCILRKYKKRFKLQLCGFCLMPNHIHLVAKPQKPRDLAKFMHDTLRAYTAYFNERYGKVGHLWQGRYKSKVIVEEGYLRDCIRYLELNPVRSQIVKEPAEYPWSSFRERMLMKKITVGLLDEISF